MALDNTNIASSLEVALLDYKDGLEKKIKGATSNKDATAKNYSSVLDQLQNKTCSYLKYKAVKNLFQNIDQCISIGAHKESELIQINVEALVKESETLQSQLGDVSKTLKQMKLEVYSAKELACHLVDCCLEKEKHENPDLYNALCEIPDFSTSLEDIKQKAEGAYNMADLTFCAAVNVSGIQGFASIDSLKSYSEDLVMHLSDFEKDIQANCEALNESIETTIKERSDLIVKSAESKYESLDAKCEETALCETWDTSNNKCDDSNDHPEKGKIRLQEICEKFKGDVAGEPDPGNGKFDR